jgi:hypothetical protein
MPVWAGGDLRPSYDHNDRCTPRLGTQTTFMHSKNHLLSNDVLRSKGGPGQGVNLVLKVADASVGLCSSAFCCLPRGSDET